MKFIVRKLVTLILLLCFASSCYDEYNFSIPKTEPLLVVDGWITDIPGDSYVAFSWSTTDPKDECPNCAPTDPNARVPVQLKALLKDDLGFETEFNSSFPWKKGFVSWELKNFKGAVGRTYSIEVTTTTSNSVEVFTASSKMLNTPIIDSISYIIRKGEVGKSDLFIPLIGFSEPVNERNYYLFTICGATKNYYVPYDSWKDCYGNSRVWNRSVISDTFLPSKVEGLSIDDGATIAKYAQFYPSPYYPGDGAMVLMYSIDLKTFNYFKSLLEQFDYDGGAYFPTPSSARGNISNGALGLFLAVETQGNAVFLE